MALKFLISALAAVAFTFSAVPASADAKGLEIAKQAARIGNGWRDFRVSGEMTLSGRGGATGTRRFNMSAVSSGGVEKTLLVFEWPGDIRNTALLTHANASRADNQWLFLPAFRRVKRISGGARSGSFVGSEFSYQDMVDQEPDKYKFDWLRTEGCPVGGGSCHVIDRFPKARSTYSRHRVWISVSGSQLRQTKYFDRGDNLVKTLSVSGYRNHRGGGVHPSSMRMVNHRTGRSTQLRWSGYKFNVGVDAGLFSPQALKRIN